MPVQHLTFALLLTGLISLSPVMAQPGTEQAAIPVTVKNFARAESDMYFARTVKLGGFGKFFHVRAPTPIDQQTVVAMNRDTLYSAAVFDLDAGPVSITLPESGKRFMSLLIVSEDHYMPLVGNAPGSFSINKQSVGTRYAMAVVRTLADPNNAADIQAANVLQDQLVATQAGTGTFEVPAWDPVAQGKIRDALVLLQNMSGATTEKRAGRQGEVDPVFHLLATAAGWGLNPIEAAMYSNVSPKANDGKTVHRLTVRDVPVDGFWSISVYNAKGFFEKNDLDSYSLNNLTAKANPDGSFTLQFGGCDSAKPSTTPNCLVTPVGWRYQVRQYRPRQEVIDGTWVFPQAMPVQ